MVVGGLASSQTTLSIATRGPRFTSKATRSFATRDDLRSGAQPSPTASTSPRVADIKAQPCTLDFREIGCGPIVKGLERRPQRVTKGGDWVFNSVRRGLENASLNHTVALQPPQTLR